MFALLSQFCHMKSISPYKVIFVMLSQVRHAKSFPSYTVISVTQLFGSQLKYLCYPTSEHTIEVIVPSWSL